MDTPVLALFRIASNLISKGVSDAVAQIVPEQKPSYGNVMEQLDYSDGMRLTDLADGAGMAPQSIGELVDQLEALGMVERRVDPDDRRAKRVYVTEKAKAAQRAAFEAVLASEERVAEVIGAERLAALKSDIVDVIEAYGGELPTAPSPS